MRSTTNRSIPPGSAPPSWAVDKARPQAPTADLSPPLPLFAPEHERVLMRLSDDDLVSGPTGRAWGAHGLDASVLILHRDFLRDGRKVYQLDPAAAEQLAALPAHWPELGDRWPETWCLRLPFPIRLDSGAQWTGYYVRFGPIQDGVGLLDGETLIQPLPGTPAQDALTFLLCGWSASGQPIVDGGPVVMLSGDMVENHPDGPGETARGRVLVNAVAAILDQRVSQVVAHPRHGREGREYQRRGISVSTLRLSADGLHTWRTKLIGPADTSSGGAHAAPCTHVCHAHTARYWMSLDDHPDVEPERDDDGRVIFRMTAKGRPLVAVQRPVREHVRGSGAATPRLTRVKVDR